MVERVKRQYHSPLRAEQARQTRLRILEAARSLFLEQGYPVTSVETIAVEAGVAPPSAVTTVR